MIELTLESLLNESLPVLLGYAAGCFRWKKSRV